MNNFRYVKLMPQQAKGYRKSFSGVKLFFGTMTGASNE
jgi:hypothetical protein